MMCKTNLHDSNYCDNVFNSPEAGPRDDADRQWHCMPRGFMWGTCDQSHSVHTIVSTGYMFVWWSRSPPVFSGLFFRLALFLISIQTVYLKKAISHNTDISPYCIMSLESVAYLIHRLVPKLEVKQTPDKTLAPGQPILKLDDVFNSLSNRAQAIPILSHDGKFRSHTKLYKCTTALLWMCTLHQKRG